jgi:hypothetical protein
MKPSESIQKRASEIYLSQMLGKPTSNPLLTIQTQMLTLQEATLEYLDEQEERRVAKRLDQ